MKIFDMEELLPIAADLSESYTENGGEQPVSYEMARQFMGAVMYCISEEQKFGTDTVTLSDEQQKNARETYESGYALVRARLRRIQRIHSKLSRDFYDYGNIIYGETFLGGVAEFLSVYDARFNPQHSQPIMEYPTIVRVDTSRGVEAVYQYVQYIQLEQKFLQRLPELYIRRLLEILHPGYEEQKINICRVVLRSLLGCLILGRNPGDGLYTAKEYAKIKKFVRRNRKKDLKGTLTQMVKQIVLEGYGSDMGMYHYLAADMGKFSQELIMAAEHNSFESLLVM